MKTKMNILAILALLVMLVGSTAIPVSAAPKYPWTSPYPPEGTAPAAGLKYSLLAKAAPDECFDAVGQPSTCAAGETPNKVNQAYLWGLTQSGDNLWFGTAPNVLCLVESTFLGATDPVLNNSYVCEFGSSQYGDLVLGPVVNLNPAFGDWRPPEVWAYNTANNELDDKTPADPLIHQTVGLRAAGSFDNVVFLGGPGFLGGVNLFAYEGDTGIYLGSRTLLAYNNIRKMLVYDGVLYIAFGSSTGGAVLRWTGDVSDPFQFEVVGDLTSDAAEIVAHDGHIFVSTWPVLPGPFTPRPPDPTPACT